MDEKQKIEALEEQVATMRNRIAKAELTNALVLAGAKKETLDDALALLGSKAKVAFGDDGSLSTIELDGEAHDDAASAAKAFLSTRSHFQTSEAPSTAQAPGKPQPQPVSLISSALAPAQPKPQPKPDGIPAGKSVEELMQAGYSGSDLIQAGLSDEPA